MLTKKILRRQVISQRLLLDAPTRHRMLAEMIGHFQEIPFPQVACLLSYIPIEQKVEVQANLFEGALQEIAPECKVCYPAADFESGEMQAFKADESLVCKEVGFGLVQPVNGNPIPAKEMDMVFVPLLAFDKKGHRLGYGKGFYDRYLAQCRPDVVKIGLSWFAPVEELPEINSLDVPLTYCVTPQALYVF